jgi:Toprim-like
LSALVPGRPLIVTEGELDCLLVAQEVGELAAVITTGSASDPPTPELIERARSASVIFAAHDDDAPGEAAAALWPEAKRIRPLAGKDWVDSWRAGERIKAFWSFIL